MHQRELSGYQKMCADILLHTPDGQHGKAQAEPFEVDISDNTFEVVVINTTEIDPKQVARYEDD